MKLQLDRFRIFSRISISTLFVVAALFAAHQTSALTVSPPLAEVPLQPGQETKTEIKLFNETDDVLTLYTEVAGWGAKDDTGIPEFDESNEQVGLATWISINPGPLQIEPDQNLVVPVAIATPVDASPGGHYAAIFFTENPPIVSGGGQVAIGAKVTTLYLGTVAGDIKSSGRIRSLSTSKSLFNRLPVDFFLQFENTGNIHLRPTGSLQITNLFGRTSGTVDVNVTKAATLPQQIREYVAVWEKNVVDDMNTRGWSGFWNELSNEWNNFALGKYTVKAALSSETEDGYITHNGGTTFWVIPWRVMLVFGLGIAFVLFMLFFAVTRYNRWIIAKAGEVADKDKPKKDKQQ